jgi:hypothetical protein
MRQGGAENWELRPSRRSDVTSRYFEGAAALVLVLASTSVTAGRVQRILCPRWTGAPRLLLLSIIGPASMVVIAEVLGLVQLFRLIPFIVANVAVATAAICLARRRGGDDEGTPIRLAPLMTPKRQVPWWEPATALAAVALVVAEWGPGTVEAYRTGMGTIDTLWYHMPFAAQFAQSGSITSLQNINNDNVIAFYPASSEVVHAIGIVLLGNDLLSPIINLGWLAIALLAGWCIGVRFGVPSLTLLAVACVMGTTELVADEPGSGYNDVVGIALVLASLAIVANLDRPWDARTGDRSLFVAALAAGLAVGVKYPFAFPVGALTVCVIASLPKGRRMRLGLAWCGVAGAMSVVWYARNLIDADNPIPNLHIGVGSVRLPSPVSYPAISLVHFLTDGADWRVYFFPGLGQAFGPADIVLLVLAAAGLLVGTVGRPSSRGDDKPLVRALGAVGIVTVLGYVITPQPNLPSAFVYDLRFMALAVVLGLIALPIVLCRFRWVTALAGVFGAVLIAAQFARGIWSAGPSLVAYHALVPGLIAGAVVLILGAGVIGVRRAGRWPPITWRIVATTLVAALLVSGSFLQNFYLTHRYTTGPQAPVYQWADTVHHARIGVSGLILNYPLFGNDLSNQVVFVGDRTTHDYDATPPNCTSWRRAVNAGHFKFVVAWGPEAPRSALAQSADGWTRTDRSAHLVATAVAIGLDGYERTDVFAIRGRLDPGQCGPR